LQKLGGNEQGLWQLKAVTHWVGISEVRKGVLNLEEKNKKMGIRRGEKHV